jgi:hypothetical protein
MIFYNISLMETEPASEELYKKASTTSQTQIGVNSPSPTPINQESNTTMNQTKISEYTSSEMHLVKTIDYQVSPTVENSMITLKGISDKPQFKVKYKWSSKSQDVFCPACNQRGMSRVSTRSGLTTYLVCIALCCLCPLNTYIFCCDRCKDTYHHCKYCSNLLGSNKII